MIRASPIRVDGSASNSFVHCCRKAVVSSLRSSLISFARCSGLPRTASSRWLDFVAFVCAMGTFRRWVHVLSLLLKSSPLRELLRCRMGEQIASCLEDLKPSRCSLRPLWYTSKGIMLPDDTVIGLDALHETPAYNLANASFSDRLAAHRLALR
jgi:hypothetical protein